MDNLNNKSLIRVDYPESAVAKHLGSNLQIQSMRAIAVLFVIFYHMELGLNRGYLGVDVFFVISGFVITLKAIEEIKNSGSFNIRHFLARRFFRLLPALSVMLLIAAFLSLVFQTPFQPVGQQQVTAKTGLSGLSFVANFQIPKISSGYFGTLAQNNAMTHLWSTSVEGQFYLFYSILIILFLRIKLNPNKIFIIMILVSLLSIKKFFTGADSLVFFSTFARVWEFSLGIALALITQSDRIRKLLLPSWIVNCISYLAAILLLIGQFNIFKGSSNPPLILTLIGTVGTLFLSALHQNHPTARILENKSLNLIGNASYSIYLWHWPLIIFLGLTWGNSKYYSLTLFPLTLGLGLASYYLIEKKFKYIPQQSSFQSRKILAITLLATISLSSLGYGAKTGWGLSLFGLKNPPNESVSDCKTFVTYAPSCLIESHSHRKKIFLVGDSQAGSLAKPFAELAQKNEWDFYLITSPGEPYLNSRCSIDGICADPRTKTILDLKPDYLVLANLWNLKLSASSARTNFESMLLRPLQATVTLNNTKIIVISPIPIVKNFSTKFTLFNRYILRNWHFEQELSEYQAEIRSLLEAKTMLRSRILVIAPYSRICNSNSCHLLEGKISIYQDASHLTPQGSVIALGNLDFIG